MSDLDQCKAIDCAKEGHSFFLTGAGGTGKSFVIKSILEALRGLGKDVALTAMTGCAALLLGKGARTLHSWAGIGLGKEPTEVLVKKIRTSKAKKNWLSMDTLIIDEISMMLPELLDKLDELGRMLRRGKDSAKPFGGIQVILVGDMNQLPPVTNGEQRFVFESNAWKNHISSTVILTTVHRQSDPVFLTILQEARAGNLSEESIRILETRKTKAWKRLEIRPTLLFTRRDDVEHINTKYLNDCEGPEYAFDATTIAKGMSKQEIDYAIEKLDKNGSYLLTLRLRKGAQVMLLSNKYSEQGLVNGSRGIVESFDPLTREPLVKFINGIVLSIGQHEWESDEFPGIKRCQIPLRLAYALTIHKAQGATLDCALIEIGRSTFEYGQAYVALSRVKSLDALYIWDLDPRAFKVHPKVVEFNGLIAAQ
jgi:ATP-dependent DNA helicase PIF1